MYKSKKKKKKKKKKYIYNIINKDIILIKMVIKPCPRFLL